MTYTNSNIDLLYEDGQVANVNALADAVLHESRAINDVTFAEDAAILATDFGLVVLDDSSLQVREFRYYGKALTSAAMVGDYMIVSYGGNLYSTNARREVLADFYAIGVSQANARIYPVNDSTFFLLGTGALKRCDMDPGGRCDIVPVFAATPDNVQQTVGGWLANFRASSCYYTIANNEASTAINGAVNAPANLAITPTFSAHTASTTLPAAKSISVLTPDFMPIRTRNLHAQNANTADIAHAANILV